MTRFKTLVVALLAGLLLVGCASPPGSVAIKVGDQQVSVRTVEDTVALLVQHPEIGQVNRSTVVQTYVMVSALEQIAKDRNISVSPEEVQAMAAQARLFSDVRKDPVGEEFVTALARADVIIKKLPVDWQREVAKYDVQLNPRYGNWHPETGRVDGFGVLAEPVGLQ